jgi:hypothetical protein
MNRLYKYLILLMIFAFGGADAWSMATIEAIGGAESVAVKREGKEVQLKKGDVLKTGDEVVTGKTNAVDLRFPDKSLIRVGANSSYRLEEDSGKNVFHRFMSGIVRVLVPPKKEGSGANEVRFRMSTPEGTIGVRGTEFVVIRSGDQTTLKGLEGEVMFGKANSDFANAEAFVMVKRGFESTVKAGGAPSQPKSFALPIYLKEIEGRGNSAFGGLADRTSGKTKTRAAVVATQTKPAVNMAAAQKGMSVLKKAIPKLEKAQEETNPQDALIRAAGMGEKDKVRALLGKKGVDVNYQDESGMSALLAATLENQQETVKLLVASGANVNTKFKDGTTPLMAILIQDSPNAALALFLVEKGADLEAKNNMGFTALQIAEDFEKKDKEKYQDVVPVLRGELSKPEEK